MVKFFWRFCGFWHLGLDFLPRNKGVPGPLASSPWIWHCYKAMESSIWEESLQSPIYLFKELPQSRSEGSEQKKPAMPEV